MKFDIRVYYYELTTIIDPAPYTKPVSIRIHLLSTVISPSFNSTNNRLKPLDFYVYVTSFFCGMPFLHITMLSIFRLSHGWKHCRLIASWHSILMI